MTESKELSSRNLLREPSMSRCYIVNHEVTYKNVTGNQEVLESRSRNDGDVGNVLDVGYGVSSPRPGKKSDETFLSVGDID